MGTFLDIRRLFNIEGYQDWTAHHADYRDFDRVDGILPLWPLSFEVSL
jgi:hypothetical protein